MQRPALTDSSNKTTKLAYQLPFLRISGRDTFSFLCCLSLSSWLCNISAKNIGMIGAYLSRVYIFPFFIDFHSRCTFCFAFVMGAKLLIFTLIGLAISVDGSDDPSKRQLILKHNLKIHLRTWRFVFFKMVTTFLYTSRFVCKNRNNSQNASAENQIAPKLFLKSIFNFLIILV